MTQLQHAETMTDAELEDWGLLALPLAEPLGDPMPTKGVETWSSEDGKTSTGIWECGPGPSRWEMKGEGELIHVVSGRMTCTAEDGTVTEIGPGRLVHVRARLDRPLGHPRDAAQGLRDLPRLTRHAAEIRESFLPYTSGRDDGPERSTPRGTARDRADPAAAGEPAAHAQP